MPATYDCIATTTLGTAQSSVTFSSISGTYTDLVFVMSARSSNAVRSVNLRFNSDTGTNYSEIQLYGDGISTAYAFRGSNQTSFGVSQIAASSTNEYVTGISNIINYANTTTFKTTVLRWGQASTDGGVVAKVALWRSTAAITSINVFPAADNFASGSTFTLYGIKAA